MRKKRERYDDKYFESLYSSKRRLKKKVLLQERFLAQAVAMYLRIPIIRSMKMRRLDSDIEWLLTWKLKTGCCPRAMLWCDGLEKLKVKRIGKYRMAFKSDIWVGLEDGSGNTSKGFISGEIEVRHTAKKLKSYLMIINHEGAIYTAKKM
ncbi:hypothetical protein KFZ76_15495 [Methylovulum psychrotolerans]|jgi:hypothetical protein|uniref:hypothetical protein n=1 Tax=Methylovulum psychrotolerans TaxID=1704499 RepID=UPI001BFF0250|nr:hypothetical protein [Methylovulum psychrotolerans]MBT9099105.1 hypothetical protein [Methylovulum psychrotolerans]